MQKITFENLPSTNTPLSASNLNTMQSNIETEIDNHSIVVSATEPTTDRKPLWLKHGSNVDDEMYILNNNTYESFEPSGSSSYVSAETVIGTWIDGKPLYRQVFTGTASASGEVLSTTFTYNLISSDCSTTFYNGTNYIHFANFVTSDYNCGVYGNKDTGRLIFYYKKGTDTHSADYKVIVTYTKPTD